MRACRTDRNHGEIRDALRAAGCLVVDTSRMGGGFPDLVAAKGGQIRLLEIKDGAKVPSARKLTSAEAEFVADCAYHGVTVHVVTSVEDAFAAMGIEVTG